MDDNRTVLDDWDVDLGQIAVWGQGNDVDDNGRRFDLYSFGGWDNVGDVGFGDSLHKQFPQLLPVKGIRFGISCPLLGVLPSELLSPFLPDSVLFLPDFTLALSGREKLSVTLFPGPLVVVLGLSARPFIVKDTHPCSVAGRVVCRCVREKKNKGERIKMPTQIFHTM